MIMEEVPILPGSYFKDHNGQRKKPKDISVEEFLEKANLSLSEVSKKCKYFEDDRMLPFLKVMYVSVETHEREAYNHEMAAG